MEEGPAADHFMSQLIRGNNSIMIPVPTTFWILTDTDERRILNPRAKFPGFFYAKIYQLARWRSGNAAVCKTAMQGFDSPPCLIKQMPVQNPCLSRRQAGISPQAAINILSIWYNMSETLRTNENETGWFEKMGAFVLGVMGILKNALLGTTGSSSKKN